MKKLITFLLASLIYSCQTDVNNYIPFIEGYWEIVSVTKEYKKIKEFKISGTIDYFKINDDLSGYRKKVTPRFDGSIEAQKLWINYLVNGVTYSEEITRANESSLIIANSDGFIYTYKPYEPLIFD